MRGPTNRLPFGQKTIEKLPIPKEGRVTFYDSGSRGLGVRVESSGRKSYFWFRKVNGRPTFRVIGEFPTTSVDQARGEAFKLSAELETLKRADFQGPNPFERPRGEITLSELLNNYVDRQLKSEAKRPEKAEASDRWMFKKYLYDWRDRKLSMISRRDVIDLHGELGKTHKITANRVVQLVRRLYNFAIDQELTRTANPGARIKMYGEKKRKRFIEPQEMPMLVAALKNETSEDLKHYVYLSLWTGARKSDVMSMRWEDVLPLESNRWSVPDPKGEPYDIALDVEVVKILRNRLKTRIGDNPWVFPSFGKTGHVVDLKKRWSEMLKRAKLTDLRQHDLRRSYGAYLARGGTPLLTISKSLGHASIQATQIYTPMDLTPMRVAGKRAVKSMIAAGKKKPRALPAARS